MAEEIIYCDYKNSDFAALVRMSQKLWLDYEANDLTELLKQVSSASNQRIYLAKTADGECIGFSILSIRTDYVEGAEKSPTGYLEGIYVEPEYRKNKIASTFLKMGELWCKEKGCSQIGSDTWLTNKASRTFHKRLGFREEDELVHFLKEIE